MRRRLTVLFLLFLGIIALAVATLVLVRDEALLVVASSIATTILVVAWFRLLRPRLPVVWHAVPGTVTARPHLRLPGRRGAMIFTALVAMLVLGGLFVLPRLNFASRSQTDMRTEPQTSASTAAPASSQMPQTPFTILVQVDLRGPAQSVNVSTPQPTDAPSASPAPTPTPRVVVVVVTPTPTSAPTPTATAAPTSSPSPSPTPTRSASPTPTATPSPTSTATATPTPAPAVFSLYPTSGQVGTQVTISGSGFTQTGNIVNFGGTPIYNMSSPDLRTLTFTIPSILACSYTTPCYTTPGGYAVSVTNANGVSGVVGFTVVSPAATPPPTPTPPTTGDTIALGVGTTTLTLGSDWTTYWYAIPEKANFKITGTRCYDLLFRDNYVKSCPAPTDYIGNLTMKFRASPGVGTVTVTIVVY